MAGPIINSTAGFYRRSTAQMSELRHMAEGLERQIATGQRLERSSDDPVASARLRMLERADRLAKVDAGNSAAAKDDLGNASAQLDDIAEALIRARALALQAGSDTVSDSARIAIAQEIDVLGGSIFASINSLGTDGRALFGGDAAGPAYIRDPAGNAVYTGTATSGAISIADGIRVERGVTGPAVLDFEHGGGRTDGLAFLQSLAQAMRGGVADPAAFARDALAGFDAALDTVTRNQTLLGARAAWIDTVENTQLLRAESRAAEGGRIGGTDLASAISRLQQVLTTLEASQAGFARLSSLTLFDNI